MQLLTSISVRVLLNELNVIKLTSKLSESKLEMLFCCISKIP